MCQAVVAVVAMQSGHGGDVLLGVRVESCLGEMLKLFVVGQPNRADRPVKGFRVLLGQPIDVQR